MPIDIYSTRAMLPAIEQMPREYSFLYDMFARDMGAVEDEKAIYDYRKGDRAMAPFVVPGTGGVLMERQGFESREIGFCTIAPERIVVNDDIKGRMFGERVFGAMTPEQRAKRLLARDLVEMRKAIQRRREWMVRQVLLTGKLEVFRYTNEGRDKQTTLVADYGFTNKYSPANPWDNSDAKIEYDMQRMYDLVYDGLGTVDRIVMDPETAIAMLENSKYIKQFDGRNINMGEINTRYRGAGVRFVGWNSDGVEMYSLHGTFLDDDGKTEPVLPKGTLIMGGSGIIKVPHGPVTLVDKTGEDGNFRTYFKKEVPERVSDKRTASIINRITSCPTAVPFNVDAWVVANTLSA